MKIKPCHHALQVSARNVSHHIVFRGDLGRTLTLDLPGENGASGIGHMDAEFDVTITPIGQEQPEHEPKTIDWAIKIMNKNAHLCVEWFKKPWNANCDIADSVKGYRTFHEAIMAAEWYERNPESK